jgi:predicted nucleic acid-binding protein
MKVAFDTSVLVAGSVARHVHEARAHIWFQAAREGKFDAITTTHALAETWATLTAIPVEPRIAPAAVERVIERLVRHIKPIALRWDDYKSAMQRCGERGLRSGTVYDALHYINAARQDADLFLTFNTRHFIPLAADDGPRIVAPPDPPALFDG